jgi:hypothetical protein
MFSRALGITIVITALTAIGCAGDPVGPYPTSDGQSACTIGNCPGCCQGGICVTPPTAAACGSGGFPCIACNQGQSCANGACVGGCSTSNCPGCCKNGVCLGGFAHSTCGKGGGECIDCSLNGGICESQACKTNAGCGPTTCNGCCNGKNCVKNPGDKNCGKSGNQCVDCTKNGDTCDVTAGTCKTSSATCGASNCKGCCNGNTCVTTLADVTCGVGGAKCEDCTASSKTCNTGTGVCESGSSTCTPSNCASGCCSGTTCVTSLSNTQCGKGGMGCINCALQNKTCEASTGTCAASTSCGPSSCTGCCQGNTCMAGASPGECGSNGAPCVKCPHQAHVCTQGQCKIAPSSKWELIATSAVINQLKKWDSWPKNPAPDGYFGVKWSATCSQYSLDKCSKSHDNTYNPVWNYSMGTVDASKLLAPWCAFVGESDSVTTCIPPFQTIGMCQMSISELDLVKGSKVVYSCPNPDGTNYVTYLQVNFNYKP